MDVDDMAGCFVRRRRREALERLLDFRFPETPFLGHDAGGAPGKRVSRKDRLSLFRQRKPASRPAPPPSWQRRRLGLSSRTGAAFA